jgi:hypothetical protein
MNTELIKIALQSAYQLLSNEIQSIEFKELQNEYLAVIEKLESAIKEIG